MGDITCSEKGVLVFYIQNHEKIGAAKLYQAKCTPYPTRKMFLLTKTKRPKKVHCNIIYSRKRFLKIKTCSAERRSES